MTIDGRIGVKWAQQFEMRMLKDRWIETMDTIKRAWRKSSVIGSTTGSGTETGRDIADDLHKYGDEHESDRPANSSADEESRPLVLVIEDNRAMNRFVARILGNAYRIKSAFNGQEGLEEARRIHPDLIVSDIMMPQMRGDQMIRKLRSDPDLRDIPIVVLTAKEDDEQRVQLLKEGVEDHLMKPVGAEELLARVDGLIQRRKENVRKLREVNKKLQQRVAESTALAEQLQERGRELETALESMRVARVQAEQASKLKSDFLSLVSHELRTPLASLRLQIERAQISGESLPADVRELLRRMDVQSQRLHELIDGLLNYTRIRTGRLKAEIEDFDVQTLASNCADEIRPQAEARDLELRLDLADDLPVLRSDVRLVRLIIINLLVNATKFTETGSVTLTVSKGEDADLRISVSDTGPGIPPDQQRRIFEPFEQLELIPRKHLAGMGLGLALVRELVSSLGGSVTVDSKPGEGSTFTVSLQSLDDQ